MILILVNINSSRLSGQQQLMLFASTYNINESLHTIAMCCENILGYWINKIYKLHDFSINTYDLDIKSHEIPQLVENVVSFLKELDPSNNIILYFKNTILKAQLIMTVYNKMLAFHGAGAEGVKTGISPSPFAARMRGYLSRISVRHTLPNNYIEITNQLAARLYNFDIVNHMNLMSPTYAINLISNKIADIPANIKEYLLMLLSISLFYDKVFNKIASTKDQPAKVPCSFKILNNSTRQLLRLVYDDSCYTLDMFQIFDILLYNLVKTDTGAVS